MEMEMHALGSSRKEDGTSRVKPLLLLKKQNTNISRESQL